MEFQIFNNPQFCHIIGSFIFIIFFTMIIKTIRMIDYSFVAWFLDFHRFNWYAYNLSHAEFITIIVIEIKVNLIKFNQIFLLISIVTYLHNFIENIDIISESICITYVLFLLVESFIFKSVFKHLTLCIHMSMGFINLCNFTYY